MREVQCSYLPPTLITCFIQTVGPSATVCGVDGCTAALAPGQASQKDGSEYVPVRGSCGRGRRKEGPRSSIVWFPPLFVSLPVSLSLPTFVSLARPSARQMCPLRYRTVIEVVRRGAARIDCMHSLPPCQTDSTTYHQSNPHGTAREQAGGRPPWPELPVVRTSEHPGGGGLGRRAWEVAWGSKNVR